MKISRQCIISICILTLFIMVLTIVLLTRANTADKENAGPDSSVKEQITVSETKPIETIDAIVESDSITIKLISGASDNDIKELLQDIEASSLEKANDGTYKVIFKEDRDPSELNVLIEKALTHAIVEECSLTYAGQ